MVNIVDFSRELGISISTVSKALNNYPDVSEATRKRVMEEARLRGYQPTSSARSLRRKGTDRIGLIYLTQQSSHWITSMTADYFMRLLTGITTKAEEKGQNLMLYTAHWVDDPEAILRISRQKEVDGLLVIGGGGIESQLRILMGVSMPWILLGRKSDLPGVSWLQPDNFRGGYLAGSHLIEKGHTEIAYIGQDEDRESSGDRFAGLCAAMADHGLEFDPRLKVSAPFAPGGGRRAMDTLLSRSVPFSAVFFFSDGVFFEALPLLSERGIRVPEDLAAVGFENTMQGKLVSPGLTTVNVPLEEIGERAIDLLVSRVEKHESEVIAETCGVGLIVRGSS